MKPQIGQRVFLKPVGDAARRGNTVIKEYIVSKVGRKYFEAWDGSWKYSAIKFHIEGLRQVTDYSVDYELYFDMQEIIDERECEVLIDDLRKVIGNYGPPKLSLDQLRRINAIIKEGL